MSAEIVNLRQVRKRKQREADLVEAENCRRQFGRTKAEKSASEAEKLSAARSLDGHRRISRDEPSA